LAPPLAPEPKRTGRGAVDWRNKAIAPYKMRPNSPALGALHGFGATMTPIHCFAIAFFMAGAAEGT
jgi:hypothetical protein